MLLLILALFVTGTVIVAWTVAGRRLEETTDSQDMESGTLLSILVPKLNDKNALSAEMMFASLHGLLSKTPGLQEHLSFELVATIEGIRFYVYIPTYFRTFVEGQIYAQYPNANISEVSQDYVHHFSADSAVVTAAEITLAKDYFFPIKTFVDFQVDPLAAITGSVERLNQGEQVWMQILLRPLDDIWQEAGYKYVAAVKEGKSMEPSPGLFSTIIKDVTAQLASFPKDMVTSTFSSLSHAEEEKKKDDKPKLSAGQELEIKAIENKMTKLGFETAIRIVSIGQSEQASQQALASIIASLKQFTMTHLNSFQISPVERRAEDIFHDYQTRAFPGDDDNYFVLNTEELASIYHLPNLSVETPTIAWSKAKQAEPPLDIPQDVPTIFAKTAFRSREVYFGIRRDDRRRHMYMIGKTGTGKSTLMENMIMKDILNGEGLAVMDPHGDMIDKLLDNIPEERIEDVVLFDPSDVANPVSFNMLELMDPSQKNLTASAMVDVFKRTFDSWGPRLEYLLRNCFLTLAEVPNTTLLGVNRLLLDKDYRKYIVSLLEDEQLRAFWLKEYATMASNDRLITEAVAPIQNKVGQFLQTSTIRNIVGQAKSTIRVDEIMNTGKILLVNLSKGKIGNDNSALLGSMMIARLQSAAMTRVNIPESERKDFYVYADEFQNFATTSFATILSEARKYRLNLIITHQYIDQLPEEVRTAVFGNVGTTINFTVSPNDAAVLAQQYAPVFTPDDLVSLEKHHIYLKLMVDGMESRPFSASTLPPIARHEGHKAAIIEASRRKYARPVTEVEERIAKWNLKKFEIGVDDVAARRLRDGKASSPSDTATSTRPSLPAQSAPAFGSRSDGRSSTVGQPFASAHTASRSSASTNGNLDGRHGSNSSTANGRNSYDANNSHQSTTNNHSAAHADGQAGRHQPTPPANYGSQFSQHRQAAKLPSFDQQAPPDTAHPPSQSSHTPHAIHGIPGGVGYTSPIRHHAISGTSGEIILSPSPAGHQSAVTADPSRSSNGHK